MLAGTNFSTAILSDWFARVQRRRSSPSVLTPAEIRALLGCLPLRERVLVLLAASTGVRQSELFGIKWGDVDFARNTMNVVRSIVSGVVGPCKTESSQKPVSVHPTVLDTLCKWRVACRYSESSDWIFARRRYRGRKPIRGQAILRRYIRPAALRAGIEKRFGWHTFKHTYSTLLRSVGTEFKVMQELLRHSLLRSTLDVYTQAISPAKHAAQAAVLGLSSPWQRMQTALLRTLYASKVAKAETALIEKKGRKWGVRMHPFAPSLVSAKSEQLFWNEWRGRRDSNPRPLP
jgi:integrase